MKTGVVRGSAFGIDRTEKVNSVFGLASDLDFNPQGALSCGRRNPPARSNCLRTDA
jgi:hypothetical protein